MDPHWPRPAPCPRRWRLVTDGGAPEDDAETDGEEAETDGEVAETDGDVAEDEDDDAETDGDDAQADVRSDETPGGVGPSNVEVAEPGEVDPADPKWEPPDMDDVPEFEVRADEPVVRDEAESSPAGGKTAGPGGEAEDPTAGRPNTARSPGATRVSTEGAESYVVAMEICARLPESVRLPPEAADLVPAAVEAELEQDIEAFAASEFGAQTPTVDTLDFREVDGDIWMRLRIGVPPDAFADLDPEVLRRHALQELEGVL